jgi:primosomal protein N' (replication factor Y)
MTKHILKIALDVPLDRLFDYLDGGLVVQIGQRVVVPFGRRKLVGIVMDIVAKSDVPQAKLKAVLQVFGDEPPLDSETFALLRFCADYYQYPYGQALLAALPTRLRQTEPAVSRKQHVYSLTDLGKAQEIDAIPARKAVQRRVFSALLESEQLSESALAELSGGWRKAMQVMVEDGWVQANEVLAGLNNTHKPDLVQPELNQDQVAALSAILGRPFEALSKLPRRAQDEAHGTQSPRQYTEYGEGTSTAQQSHVPTQALNQGFKSWLLHGITGSGKTEVYIRLIQSVLAGNDGQVLVLVPEINLTPQLEARFRSRLPDFPLVALHSNLGESERLQNWRLAQSGQARIVIGTRLAVFTPMPNLRLIIVDEEHDGSYKQQDGMRYHARDVALMRAKHRNIPILLGSATPALETWHNALTDKYSLLKLADRAVAKAVLPNIRCIDVSKGGTHDGLSPILVEAMRERLNRGEQSLLFINRRGYAPVLLCSACNWIAPCSRCSSRLVVHLKQGRLRCHHCGHEEKIPRQCPSCGNPDLHPTGHGTQRLEQTLATLLPEARILRVDRDSTRRKDALTDMLAAVHADEVDILVGTQMLAKGHDFPNLTLVGVIDTDSALFSPDFRAAERLFAQLMQVAGRAGRADKAGEVLIQTAFPDHALFNALRVQDYAVFSEALLSERKITQFPPYAFMALLRAEANDFALVQRFLKFAADLAREIVTDMEPLSKRVRGNQDEAHGAQNPRQYKEYGEGTSTAQQSHDPSQTLNQGFHVMVYDPVRPSMERLKGMERGHLLMQAGSRQAVQVLLRNWVPQLRESALGAKVRWAVDVDPLEF